MNINSPRGALAGYTLMILLAAQTCRAEIIDTYSLWNDVDNIFFFGDPNTASYGQTITAGSDNVLTSFTFWIRQYTFDPVTFRAYVMEWNPATLRATGPILFSSADFSTSNSGLFDEFEINTGGVTLTPGTQYVLFFNVSLFDGIDDASSWAALASSDPYAGGAFVFLNNGPFFDSVRTDPWTTNWLIQGGDLAFRAVFVPEPSAWALSCLGAGACIAAAWQRRKPCMKRTSDVRRRTRRVMAHVTRRFRA